MAAPQVPIAPQRAVAKAAGRLIACVALSSLVGIVVGSASALFLWLLDLVTAFRMHDERVVWLLPLAGLVIGAIYERFGAGIKGGTDLVIATIHDDGPEIPARMAPMVLIGTLLTHLFGGSAGREGTAVQMGAALSDGLSHRLRLTKETRQQLLYAGVAAGFGSVFGTPLAGAVFALEFTVCGRIHHRGLLPALIAALVGDFTTRGWGVGHTVYAAAPFVSSSPLLLLKWLLVAGAVAAATITFVELVHIIKHKSQQHLRRLPLRMAAGGACVVLLWQTVGTSAFLGLGVPTIVRAFEDPHLPAYAFALKILFTALTIGMGFLGGEVTPLFFIGATLGNLLGGVLGVPLELAAGVGLAAAFGCASNAPIALSIMAVELLGAGALPHVAIVTAVAYVLTGRRGIYGAQRVGRTKWDWGRPPLRTLAELRPGVPAGRR